MGRILEALKQTTIRRVQPADTAPLLGSDAPPFRVVADAPSLPEIPYIEVGGPRKTRELSSVELRAPGAWGKNLAPGDAPRHPGPLPLVAAPPAPSLEPAALFVSYQASQAEAAVLPPPSQRFAPALLAFHDPEHPVSEKYRQLLTALRAGPSLARPQAWLLAPACAGAGATTVVLNLALTAARRDSGRIAVVDAAWPRPAVAQRLGLPASPGLREVLMGQAVLETALRETGQARLTALTAGRCDGDPATVLAGPEFQAIIDQLKNHCDLVLVDSPPWTTRKDVALLSSACDAAYLVLRQGVSPTALTVSGVQLIQPPPAAVTGYITTEW
jgi:Mrp family chromosome partitioning ATPase